MFKLSLKYFLISILILLLSACTEQTSSPSSIIDDIIDENLDNELQSTLSNTNLTGDPTIGRTLPNINEPIPQLGMKLFFSKGLGGQKDTACVSCHHPKLGGGDDLSLSIGVSAVTPDLLGPGRLHSPLGVRYEGDPTIPRNALTTFNIALWDEVLFIDGRVESLTKTPGQNGAGAQGIRTPESAFGVADDLGNNLVEAQAHFPVTSLEEMKGHSFTGVSSDDGYRNYLATRFQTTGLGNDALATNDWLVEFQAAFGAGTAASLITYSNIAHALAEYQRSQIFINNPFKTYIEGDTTALSSDAKRGALLFFRTKEQGGANCISCHSGDFYTDEKFHNVAMPQTGRSKDNFNGVNANDDFGRYRETRLESDKYKFRTPTLLNVTETGPWGHTGAYTSLFEAVKHHFNPQAAIDNYDFNQIDPSIDTSNTIVNTQFAVDKLQAERATGNSPLVLQDVNLGEVHAKQIVEFLKSFTDPCITTETCINKWIPGATDNDPDLLRVNAIDGEGQPL